MQSSVLKTAERRGELPVSIQQLLSSFKTCHAFDTTFRVPTDENQSSVGLTFESIGKTQNRHIFAAVARNEFFESFYLDSAGLRLQRGL
jgi:hypothetical protein